MIDIDELHKKIDSIKFFGTNNDPERDYLGASSIGDECSRKLWLVFHRYVEKEQFDPRMFRLFFRGKTQEPVVESMLEECGFKIVQSCLSQANFKHGFFGGSGDGVYEYDGKRVAVEVKTCSDKNFAKLKRGNLREVQPKHYAQCQIYQKEFDCAYALYVAINKNTDEIFLDTIEFNADHYKEYCDKADYIAAADKPPERIASKSTDFRCKFCHAHAVCWGMQMPRVNCRNCTSVAKEPSNGVFRCDKKKELDTRGFCEHHSFSPYAMQDLQQWEPIEFFPTERAVKYKKPSGETIINGFKYIQSKDLQL